MGEDLQSGGAVKGMFQLNADMPMARVIALEQMTSVKTNPIAPLGLRMPGTETCLNVPIPLH
eukprot:110787-Rhodomonas_salina.3